MPLAAAAREKAWAALAERREAAVKAYVDARADLLAAIDELEEVSRLCAVQAGRPALVGQLPRHLAAAIRLKQLGDGRILPEAIS